MGKRRKPRTQPTDAPIQDIGTPERHGMVWDGKAYQESEAAFKNETTIARNDAGRPKRAESTTAAHRMWDTGSAELLAVEKYIRTHAMASGVRDRDGAGGGVAPWARVPTSDVQIRAGQALRAMQRDAERGVERARGKGVVLPLPSPRAAAVMGLVLVEGVPLRRAAVALRCPRDGFTAVFRKMVEGMAG